MCRVGLNHITYIGFLLLLCVPAQTQEPGNSVSVAPLPVLQLRNDEPKNIVLTKDKPAYNVYSPGFPDEVYEPDTQALLNVQISLADKAAEMGARILVTFEMFALQSSEYCTSDGLEIYQDNYHVGVFCASQSGEIFLSQSSSFNLRFFSDAKIEERGFNLRIEIFESPCAKTFLGVSTGTLTSPGFPGYYQSNELCVWKIVAPSGKRVRLGFNEVFDIQGSKSICLNDFVTVSINGNLNLDSNRYCGKEAPAPIFSENNEMLVKFTSDCCFQSRGFSASFSIVDQEVKPTEEPFIPSNCNCGKENVIENRVVGGSDSIPNQFPWMTGLYDNDMGVFCGAALISTQYVLTAAHCLKGRTPQNLKIVLGAHNLKDSPEPVGVDKIIINPSYNKTNYNADIALIRLKNPATFGKKISPVCLPNIDFETNDRMGYVTGWGKIKEAGDSSSILKIASMNTVTLAECKLKYGTAVFDSNVCAGGNKTDACQGDSGGPFSCKFQDRQVLIGIVSWGIGCGRDGYPGIFSKVPAFIPWIEQVTQDAPPCAASKESAPLEPNLSECGLANRQITNRVVGGYPVNNLEYPWMAVISVDGAYKSVGTLISPRFVITARHWLTEFPDWYLNDPNRFKIILGRHDLSVSESEEAQSKKYSVSKITVDPNFNKKAEFDRDFAIFKLTEDVNTVFKPICLPRAYEDLPDGSPVYAIGWGQTSTNGRYSDVLREVSLLTINRKTCQANHYNRFNQRKQVTNYMLCASAKGKGMCKGDGGAPLMAFYKGRWYLTGITSWGSLKGCAVENEPDVFAKVNSNLPFIRDITGLKVGLQKP